MQAVPKTFKEIVQAELNGTASPEERMSLYESVESLRKWLTVLEETLITSKEQLENQRSESQIKINRIMRGVVTVKGRDLASSDPQFLSREDARVQELQSSLKFLEREMQDYWNKIEVRKAHIQEKLLFQAEQDQQLLEEYLFQEEKVLVHGIERQEQFRIAALLNWKSSMARGALVGASYLYRLIEKGLSPQEAYMKIEEFIDGPLKVWRNDPHLPLPLLEDFLNDDVAGPHVMSLEDTY
jgi:hypothetical protein